MHRALAGLIDRLDSPQISRTSVIRWGCPVPSFGNPTRSRIATLGLNPSNREFLDDSGNELQGPLRRFHTLSSLEISSWSEVDVHHLHMILDSCNSYFLRNPYDRWFTRLERALNGLDASYYGHSPRACHIDLIPYATMRKWADLTPRERSSLMTVASDTLGLLLRDSSIQILILNGRSVVRHFEELLGSVLEKQAMHSWSLRRQARAPVIGFAYKGVVSSVGGLELGRRLLVLGFNHNLQSSFGVTKEVVQSIRAWISAASNEAG